MDLAATNAISRATSTEDITPAACNAIVMPMRKSNRPKRIPNPISPEEKFIMFADVVKKANKAREVLTEMRARKIELMQELVALPRIYVKNNEELKRMDDLIGFRGELYVGVGVDDSAINEFEQKHNDIRITRKAVVSNQFP